MTYATMKEYDACAGWCAIRAVMGKLTIGVGMPLPENISADCFWEIENDIDAFLERVRATAYGISQSGVTDVR